MCRATTALMWRAATARSVRNISVVKGLTLPFESRGVFLLFISIHVQGTWASSFSTPERRVGFLVDLEWALSLTWCGHSRRRWLSLVRSLSSLCALLLSLALADTLFIFQSRSQSSLLASMHQQAGAGNNVPPGRCWQQVDAANSMHHQSGFANSGPSLSAASQRCYSDMGVSAGAHERGAMQGGSAGAHAPALGAAPGPHELAAMQLPTGLGGGGGRMTPALWGVSEKDLPGGGRIPSHPAMPSHRVYSTGTGASLGTSSMGGGGSAVPNMLADMGASTNLASLVASHPSFHLPRALMHLGGGDASLLGQLNQGHLGSPQELAAAQASAAASVGHQLFTLPPLATLSREHDLTLPPLLNSSASQPRLGWAE